MAAKQNNPQRRETLFPGIFHHAETLGCHRGHLYLVLKGERSSPRLLKDYKSLLKKEGRPIPAALSARNA